MRQPDGTAGIVGPVRVEMLASTASQRQHLIDMGYLGGYLGSYVAPARGQVDQIFLLQFKEPGGARRYLSDAYGKHSASDPPTFTASAVPSSTGFFVSDKVPSIAILAFAKGRFYVQSQVSLTTEQADLRSSEAALAETEYRLLP